MILRLAWTVARVNKALVCEEVGGGAEKMSSGGQWHLNWTRWPSKKYCKFH